MTVEQGIEDKIDEIVYGLYGITDEERKIAEDERKVIE